MKLIKKPHNYWTKDRCRVEALKYNKKCDFKLGSPSAYSKSEKMKWFNDICSHMFKKKPNNYWHKDNCHNESLKYLTRKEFGVNSPSAYISARKNNWLDEICGHMLKIGNYKYRCVYSYEFIEDNHVYVGLTYNINIRHNSRIADKNDPVTKHIAETGIQPIRKILCDYILVDDAILMEGKCVENYRINGWILLNKAKTGGIGGNIICWTKERCINVAENCKNSHEFNSKYKGAYSASLKKGWINEINIILNTK